MGVRRERIGLAAVYAAALVGTALLVVAPPPRPPVRAAVATMAPLPSQATGRWLADRVALPPAGLWLHASVLAACGWYGAAASALAVP